MYKFYSLILLGFFISIYDKKLEIHSLAEANEVFTLMFSFKNLSVYLITVSWIEEG